MNYFIRKSGNRPDIHKNDIPYPSKNLLIWALQGIFLQLVLAYLFYQSAISALLLSPITIIVIYHNKKKYISAKKEELRNQFKDFMLGISAALKAGYSMENAVSATYGDMKILHGNMSRICLEMQIMNRQLANNKVLEAVLSEFASRSGVKEIEDFAEVFRVAKRSGGNLSGMIQETVDTISGKIDTERDIRTILHAKRVEQTIMSVIPLIIIIYIHLTSPGYFTPLYDNPAGITIMTFCLFSYGGAVYWAERIADIRV